MIDYNKMENHEFDDWFDKAFRKLTQGREEHEFVHFNNALNMQIYGKEHYKRELRRKKMIPFDTAEELASQWDKDHPRKKYDEISPQAMDIIRSLKLTADKNGNIVLGNRAIEALQEIGAIPASSEHAPKQYEVHGGFN